MGHPSVENLTPFTFEPLFLADEEMRPLLVPVVKATYELSPQGRLTLAEEQAPLELKGKKWGDSDESTDRYEPEIAFFKPATDVALVGHAYAQERGARETLVALKVGTLQKGVRVIGDRVWFKSMGSIAMTKPAPFERIPLRYERAFGGQLEPRNPAGTGFRVKGSRFEEGVRLPNLEEPTQLIEEWGDRPPPAGFGFLGPHWQPRAAFGGTYDAAWEKSRKPLLPRDFDRRFLNAASPGLIAPGYLQGNEPVIIANATAEGRLAFSLPGVPPPRVQVAREDQPDASIVLNLDTVIIDTDAMRLFLLWRGHLVLKREPLEVRAIRVHSGTTPEPVRRPSGTVRSVR